MSELLIDDIIKKMEKLSDDKSIKKLIEKMEKLRDAKSKKKLIDDIIEEMKNLSAIIEEMKNLSAIIEKMEKLSYEKSEKGWIGDIIKKMENLSRDDKCNCGYTKLNRPKSKAYVSISKTLDKPYWRYSLDELAEFVKDEIENGEKLTKLLLDYINNENNSTGSSA